MVVDPVGCATSLTYPNFEKIIYIAAGHRHATRYTLSKGLFHSLQACSDQADWVRFRGMLPLAGSQSLWHAPATAPPLGGACGAKQPSKAAVACVVGTARWLYRVLGAFFWCGGIEGAVLGE